MKHSKLLWIAALAAGALAAPAVQGALVTNLGGTVITFDNLVVSPLEPAGPVQAGTAAGVNVEVSSVGGNLTLGEAFNGAWELGANGFWSQGKTFAGVGGGVDPAFGAASLVFDFGAERWARVGAFMNFDPGFSTFGIPEVLSIAALDGSGNELESYFLPLDAIDTPGAINGGAFFGIFRESQDIAKFVVYGPYAVVDDLTLQPIPEPSTYALMVAGLGLLAAVSARRRARA